MKHIGIILSMVLLFNTCCADVSAKEFNNSTESAETQSEVNISAGDRLNEEVALFSVNDNTTLFATTETSTIDSGTSGNVSWELDNAGVLIISGTGSMKSYSKNSNAPWVKYRNRIKKVIIEDGITSIGDFAFAEYQYSTSVGGASFNVWSGCNFTSISIPNTVERIGDGAFFDCQYLNNIRISKHIKYIDSEAFSYCVSLKNIKVATANPNYCDVDGVMYNKDKTTVIMCPPGRTEALRRSRSHH